MNVVLDHSFALADRPDAVVVRGREVWATTKDTRSVHRFSGIDEAELEEVATLADAPAATGGAAWDGEHLLLADAATGTVMSMEPDTGETASVFDVTELDFGTYRKALLAENSHIADLAWSNGELWLACEAGYSSSIYRINLETKRVIGQFWSPGPNPTGIALDASGERLWVIDGRRMQLVEGDTEGEWLDEGLPIPVAKARHLAIDEDGKFWTTDPDTDTVHRLRLED